MLCLSALDKHATSQLELVAELLGEIDPLEKLAE